MKGLLLKDYYLIKSIFYMILVIFGVVGFGMSFLTSTWVLTTIATIMFGMISVTTITTDKTSGWRKVSGVLPISRRTVMDSKYILYLLLSGVGAILGVIISIVVSLVKNQLSSGDMFMFICISLAMALLSGSITIPCNFLLSEEKSMISLIIAYPLTAFIFVGAILLFKSKLIACGAAVVLGVTLFIVSWMFSRKFIAHKDIG